MMSLLVLGIGSRLMMDDGIGIYLGEDLKEQFISNNISFISGETDVDYCLSKISEFERIVLIDAYESGKSPGDVTVLPICDLVKARDRCYSLHGMHLINTLQFIEHQPEGIFIGIEPYEIIYGFSLSELLQRQYQEILKSVYDTIIKYFENGGEENA